MARKRKERKSIGLFDVPDRRDDEDGGADSDASVGLFGGATQDSRLFGGPGQASGLLDAPERAPGDVPGLFDRPHRATGSGKSVGLFDKPRRGGRA